MKKSDVMLFIDSFTGNAGTLPKMAKGHPEAGPCKVSSFAISMTTRSASASPFLHSSPHGNPDASPCSISQDSLCSWLKTQDPRAELMLAKKKSHTNYSQSRSVSGLITMLPSLAATVTQQQGLLPLLLANNKKGTPLIKMFLRGEGDLGAVPDTSSYQRSAYIHLHVKLPSGALQAPGGHLPHVAEDIASQDRQCISRSVLVKWKQKAIFTAPGLTCRGQCLPWDVSQLDKIQL